MVKMSKFGGKKTTIIFIKKKSQLFKRREVYYQQMEKWCAGLFQPAAFEDLFWKPIDE